MSLLDKFSQVEVKNIDKITVEDRAFCEELQTQYDAYRMFRDKYLELQEIWDYDNEFLRRLELTRMYPRDVEEKAGLFRNKIVEYFAKKYSIVMRTYDVLKGKEDLEHWEGVLGAIFDYMEGLNFQEYAVKQAREAVLTAFRGSRLTIQNNRLQTPEKCIYQSNSVNYYSSSDVNQFLSYLSKCLALFETDGKSIQHPEFDFMDISNSRRGLDYLFGSYDLDRDCSKLVGLKFFKNGKIEFKFADNEIAHAFAREFLGYQKAA